VILAFGLFPNAIAATAMLGMRTRPKLIISEITRPIASAAYLNIFRRVTYLTLAKQLYKRSDLVTANSMDGVRETCHLIGIDEERGVRLPNIVDAAEVTLLATQENLIPIRCNGYVVCVGRLAFMKRLETVIEAFAQTGCAGEIGLLIVGDGEARQSLELQVNELGLRDAVVFTGALENPFPIVRGAAALVLASEYEGFSNSALEAMFCDVPVITSYCSLDAREMCNQGAALGFEVGDAKLLTLHIRSIIRDKALVEQLISRAKVYRAPHELSNAIVCYEDVIRRVMK
jgi:glycosyltransferase involved in cell wall biosynthesis